MIPILKIKDPNTGNWISILAIKGETGAKGDKGDTGETGAKGDTGAQGAKGDTGAKGDAFVYDDFTPEQIATLQQPATDAAEIAIPAAGLAEEKAELANNAATLANEKAELAQTAATDANNATSALNAALNSQIIEVEIPLCADDVILATGDGQGGFLITSLYNGFSIVGVFARVTVASTSGLPTFQIRKNSTDVLSTLLTIDINELNSLTAVTPAVINPANRLLSTGDMIYPDCDVAGTGTKGAKVIIQLQKL